MKRGTDGRLRDLLAECADQIRNGSTIAACLARYPEQAADLEPLLLTLVAVRQLRPVPPRSAQVMQERRAQFVLAAQQLATGSPQADTRPARRPVPAPASGWERLVAWINGDGLPRTRPVPLGILVVLIAVLVGGLFVTSMLEASARALPGDLLYPIKTTVEDVRLSLMRDPAQRGAFQAARDQLRRTEALTIVDIGREVRRMPLHGQIEAIQGDRWKVSGLEVLITQDTRIIGTPAVGATVNGTMTAPGNHTLVAVYLEVEPPATSASSPAALPPTQMAPQTAPPPAPSTSTPTPTATGTPAEDTPIPPAVGPVVRAVYDEPTEQPTRTATPLPTATPTATPTAAPTATRTPGETSTPNPTPSREQVKVRIIGWVERIEGSFWTISGTTVECDENTQFVDNPQHGSQVDVTAEVRPDGSYLALVIRRISQPNPTPAPVEFTDVVNAINGELWIIGATTVRVTGETLLENNPALGDMVSVKAERRAGGEVVALRITALRLVEVNFEGVIESMGGDGWVISGTRVIVNGSTEIRGTPEIGATAQVAALRQPDGSLVAKIIAVVAPPPQKKSRWTAVPPAPPELTPEATPNLCPVSVSRDG